jgi:hypothetical protein
MIDKRLWSSKDLAEYLGVNVWWLRSCLEIPRIRVSPKLIRYDIESPAFQAWLAGVRSVPTPSGGEGELSHCSRCGRLIDAGRNQCDDCKATVKALFAKHSSGARGGGKKR